MIPYTRMKGELEDSVNALGFDHTIILRPGLIVGGREESRPTEFVIRYDLSSISEIMSNSRPK